MKFHSLVLADLRRETADAVSIAFAIPPALREAFTFRSGQYVTLRVRKDGEELRRSYSICSGLDDGELRIGVKQVEGGRFSPFACNSLKVGDTIDVLPPQGNFGVTPAPGGVRRLVGFAAGSGITPILSIIRTLASREKASRFSLFYGNRASSSIMFREALEDLKDSAMGALSVHHILSREAQDVSLLNGRIDAVKAGALLKTVGPLEDIDGVFLCGPLAMTDALLVALQDAGIARDKIQREVFTPAEGAHAPRAAPAAAPRADGAKLSLRIDGVTHAIAMRADETVLEAAQRHGLDMPWSCRAGMCCTCRARLVSGTAAMDQNYSLEAWEMQAGFVLTCQARPTSAALSVDFDAV